MQTGHRVIAIETLEDVITSNFYNRAYFEVTDFKILFRQKKTRRKHSVNFNYY